MVIPKVLFKWLLPATVITLVTAIVHVTVQQNYRQSANDPQIQLSQDIATALSNGQALGELIPTTPVNIDSSLAPYVIVYDNSGQPIGGNGKLDNQLPILPAGLLEVSEDRGPSYRVTWQPRTDVRQALVITHYPNGYVVAGRSLYEVEQRLAILAKELLFGWLASLLLLGIESWVLVRLKRAGKVGS